MCGLTPECFRKPNLGKDLATMVQLLFSTLLILLFLNIFTCLKE